MNFDCSIGEKLSFNSACFTFMLYLAKQYYPSLIFLSGKQFQEKKLTTSKLLPFAFTTV